MKPRHLRKTKRQQSLLNFGLWFETGMDATVHNCLELVKAARPDLKNSILRFVVPRAVDGVVERFVLEIEQAWTLTDKELRHQGLRPLGISDRNYRHLKRIRNKLTAHRIENLVKTPRHLNWYTRTYGSYERVFGLLRSVAARIYEKVQYLEATHRIALNTATAPVVDKFHVKDVEALYAAIKAHNVY